MYISKKALNIDLSFFKKLKKLLYQRFTNLVGISISALRWFNFLSKL